MNKSFKKAATVNIENIHKKFGNLDDESSDEEEVDLHDIQLRPDLFTLEFDKGCRS